MKRLLLITILIAFIGGIVLLYKDEFLSFGKRQVYAIGDVTVDWGIGIGSVGPIFNISNFAPGDMESRNVLVTNGASASRPIGIRGIPTDDTDGLSAVLDIVISDGLTDLYGGTSSTGPKTLSQFFSDSSGPDGIPLFLLNSGASKTITIKVKFQESAGNEFQDKTVVFDIKIGIAIAIPEACEGIDFDLVDGLPIFGTQKGDKINGTSGNDLIFALEGGDKVDGKGGDDCIVGGAGGDSLSGGNGNDVILGEASGDSLYGDNGNDLLFGGEGGDLLRGGNNQDELYGENGSDSLKGESGNDLLIGGLGSDSANGGANTDTCDAESETSCEI